VENTPANVPSAVSPKDPDSFARWFDKVSEEKKRARELDDLQRRDELSEREALQKRAEEFKLHCPDCGSRDIDLIYEGRFMCRKCNRVFS
jgi:hypothetical protein